MRIAIVHDYLHQYGGAERVVAVLHEMFPSAPIFTSIYNPENFPEEFKSMDIKTSFMQKMPWIFSNFRAYFWLYPFAFNSFNLKGYDLILSSSSAFAKGVRKSKGAKHVCYCYNPMRFVWRYGDYISKESMPWLLKFIFPLFLYPLKIWDLMNSRKVDFFVVISKEIEKRVKSIYNRDSDIIYPPIDVAKFTLSDINKDYFLIVSRLVAYKRIDIPVRAFSQLKLPLKIVGDGPAKKDLIAVASENIEFLGKVSDEKLKILYSQCRALVFSGEEDFGMTPLEASASGRPAIAFAKGGALETVVDQKTGVLFFDQTVESLMEAIEKFEKMEFDKKELREHAKKFDKEVFKEKLRSFLHENKIF